MHTFSELLMQDVAVLQFFQLQQTIRQRVYVHLPCNTKHIKPFHWRLQAQYLIIYTRRIYWQTNRHLYIRNKCVETVEQTTNGITFQSSQRKRTKVNKRRTGY